MLLKQTLQVPTDHLAIRCSQQKVRCGCFATALIQVDDQSTVVIWRQAEAHDFAILDTMYAFHAGLMDIAQARVCEDQHTPLELCTL